MTQTTRVSIDGVSSRLALRITSVRDRRVTFEQRLPFLAIGKDVTSESGERGRIERVGVVLEGGVPKIVLEVAYDAMAPARARGDQTVAYDRRTSAPPARIESDANPSDVLAFPLETRRRSTPDTHGSWLARTLASILAFFSPRTV